MGYNVNIETNTTTKNPKEDGKMEKKLTKEEATAIEQTHNIYVDIESGQYNREGYDATYGWDVIPQAWIDEVK